MSDLQLVLLIIGGLFVLCQLAIIGIGVSYARGGNNVRIGLIWGILAAICFIAAVLL